MRYSDVAPIDLSSDAQLSKLACDARSMSRDTTGRKHDAYTKLAEALENVREAYKPEPVRVERSKLAEKARTKKTQKPRAKRTLIAPELEPEMEEGVTTKITRQMGGSPIIAIDAKGELIK